MLMDDLHNFIIQLDLFAAEQMKSETGLVKVTPALRKTDVPGEIVIMEKDYDAMFSIERFPYQQVSSDRLLAHICAWLHQQQDWWKVTQPEIELVVQVDDSYVADVDFIVQITEQVIATENPLGEIEFDGLRYAL